MKLGILGTGMIVKDFLSIASQLKDTKPTAVCNVRSSEATILEFAQEYHIKYGFHDFNKFLESEIDTVYIALPNNLHFIYAKNALEAGKNVIVEKPFTTSFEEAKILNELAREKQLYLFEAITNQYLPNYIKVKELLPSLGNIKIVQCNYSQYSSRYDSFKAGNVLPAFDPKFSGGALMDINIYNIHYVVGLFGKPNNVEYYPNMERGIDTSGILVLEYNGFQCVCIGAKDCKAPIALNIQGDKGCIHQDTPANSCKSFEVLMNDGTSFLVDENQYSHRMVNEFLAFDDMIANQNLEKCYQMLEHSLAVCEVQATARAKSGIVFEADRGDLRGN
jgi:scyllo-inositol 2-dehydrogenase (NADP+)